MRLFQPGLLLSAVLAVGAGGILPAQDEDAAPVIETAGPAELLERGRAAFAANDFEGAEASLEKFINDYGSAEEAREAARIHRPLVAIAKVGLKKFDEALEWIDQSLEDPEIDPGIEDELRFWRGICLMTTGELVNAQRAFGEYWADETHQPFKRYEALLLFATLYLQQDFPSEAADFLRDQLPKYRDDAPEAASRAVVLELHARITAGETDEALAVIRREYDRLDEMTQVISFQSLALQLGASFLEQERYHDAITCLQRVWPEARLREHQSAGIERIENRIQVLEQRPNSQATVYQLRAILKRVERELAGLDKMEDFDAAIRLRLALAFQGLGRYREAALVMEDMLETMPPSAVVENATLAQIQCWMEIGRWAKAVEVAERYVEVFGEEGPSLPTVLFLKAEALREDQNYSAAQLAYGDVVEQFPESEFAAKAVFMQGFLYLQQDDNDGALYQFDQVSRTFPDSGMVEDADYWTGMAYSFSGLYEECRDHMAGYLERYETPKYGKEATFRIAVATFSLAEYEEALEKLGAFVEDYPGDPLTDEANLLIGDAWLADGAMDEGFAAYDRVRPESGRFFEEAWFKKGNAYKLLEEFETMRAHFAEFVESYPGSGRMPEAVYWVGWTHLNEGNFEEARRIYWETIEQHGNDPDMGTVTDLFSGLPALYREDGEAGTEDLLTRLQRMKTQASVSEENLLAARAGWAKSIVEGKTNALAARTELLDIAKWVDPKLSSPTISVPVAEALLETGNVLTAENLFREIRKWHPRTVLKGRIYRALGQIAAGKGELAEAIDFYEKFEREAIQSADLGDVRLEMGEMLAERGRDSTAREKWESILDAPGVPAKTKARAILALGRSHAKAGDHRKAIVYFERVYVAYGKFSELNASAYWGRGQSLEALDLGREALETYEEFVGRADLESTEERPLAVERIEALRPLFPEEVPGDESTSTAEETP